MGIDRDHWGMMLFPDYMESARTTKVMRQELFVRAVIADEAAKASGAKSPTPGSVRRVDDAVQAVSDALGCTFAVDTHNATKTAEGIRELVEAVVALRRNSEPEPQQKEPTTVSYERFTDRARRVMQLANQEALRFNHEYIGTEHVALGLVKEHAGVASFVLNKAGIDVWKIRLEVERLVKSGPDMALMGKLPYTPRTKRVLAFAIEESQALGHLYVGTEHILLGLLREPEGIGGQVIRGLGLSLEDARRAIKDVLGEQLNKDSEPAASEPELDEPAERAEDVPKWFTSLLRPCVPLASNEQLGRHAKVLWPKFQAEIASRVQDATATANEVSRNNMETIVKLGCESMALQKKVDELTAERDNAKEANEAYWDAYEELNAILAGIDDDEDTETMHLNLPWIIQSVRTLVREREALNKCIADRNAARQQLSEARAEIERLNTTTVGKLIADAIQKDRESDERECRREIRRLRAEVERLTSGKWTPQEVNDLCHDLPKVVGPRAYADGCAKQQRELFGCAPDADRIAELEARVAEQAAEIERLSRPVECASVYSTLDGRKRCVEEWEFRRERNAREAAEAAAAELREAWRWSLYSSNAVVLHENLDAVLAAYRKQKEPTQ